MTISALNSLLKELHSSFEGLNPPASEAALAELQQAIGAEPPPAVATLYRDHDGSNAALRSRTGRLCARILPIKDAIAANAGLADALSAEPLPGRVLWFSSDDNSNYVGIFLDGPLAGWVTALDHDEPEYTPAFRSVSTSLNRLVSRTRFAQDNDENRDSERAIDIPSLPRDVPTLHAAQATDESDRVLALQLLDRYRREEDEDKKRTWALCSLCLLPVGDTSLALELLSDPDMWTPEKAVILLEMRGCSAAVPQLEMLARDGGPNGDSAAMRALARLHTPEAEAAVARLERKLTDGKRSFLDLWRGRKLNPPRW
ncbi:MAG TPA: SMI1/KNR4 family protein [Myxococcales bacterium]|jgi:hypothetical protein